MPAVTRTITDLNDVLTSVTLGAAEQEIDFVNPSAEPCTRIVQMVVDVNCWYRHVTGGPNFPILANEPFDFRVTKATGEKAFLLTQGGGAGNLYMLVTQ